MEWLIDEVERIGRKIIAMRSGSFKTKPDGSPVTKADVWADREIRRVLKAWGIPTVSEESGQEYSGSGRYFLVDPLDGTKSYIRGEPHFTINIALMNGSNPEWGIVHAPALGTTYYSDGKKSYKRSDGECAKIRVKSNNPPVQVSSLNHITEKEIKLSDLVGSVLVRMGSSIKGCLVAEGRADFYPRFGDLKDWDIAAMHAIVRDAGGVMTDLRGGRIQYSTPDRTIRGFVALNPEIHHTVLEKVMSIEVQGTP